MAKPKLRIALVAPLVTPIAPPFLGGAQVTLYELAYGLAARGHEVTMYAAEGSELHGPNLHLVEIAAGNANLNLADFNAQAKAASAEQQDAFFAQANLFLEVFMDIASRSGDFDIVHAHAFDWPAYAFAALAPVPTVHSIHLPAVDPRINALLQTVAAKRGGVSNCVTVSHSNAATYAPYFKFDRIVYSGVKVEEIPFSAQADDYVVFVGRMSPEKGVDLAIEIARRASKKLIMAGAIYNQAYFDEKIAPELESDPNLEYRGLLDRSAVFELMGRAQAAIFSSMWEEPFGLVLAEAQAAGTPVVAFRRGAAPEIMVEGETGFLVEPGDVEAAARALLQVDQISREKCRERIAQNFSFDQMVDTYVDYYYSKL